MSASQMERINRLQDSLEAFGVADPEAVECLDELLLSPQVNPVLLRILASCARDIKRCADVLDGMDRNSVSVVDGGFSPQEVEVLVKELGYLHPFKLINAQERMGVLEFLVSELQAHIMLVSIQLQNSADDSSFLHQLKAMELNKSDSQKSAANERNGDVELEQADRPIVTLPDAVFEPSPFNQQEAACFKGLVGRLNYLLGTSVSPNDPISEVAGLFLKASQYVGSKSLSTPVVEFASYSPAHQQALVKMNQNFTHHYTQRREVLLQRLKATLQSFVWSELGESRLVEISIVIRDMLNEVPIESSISLFEFYAAVSADLVAAESPWKTKVVTRVKKYLIGKVPDRGGKPGASKRKGPRSMPRFQARIDDSNHASSSVDTPAGGDQRCGARGRGGRGRGRRRGGRGRGRGGGGVGGQALPGSGQGQSQQSDQQQGGGDSRGRRRGGRRNRSKRRRSNDMPS